MPTIHQRVHGYLWHWDSGPGWVRDGSEIAKLRADGMRVLKVQLQDDGPIPAEQAQEWRDAGMKVWGMVGHVGGRDPAELAVWLKGERTRLALAGLDCNFEDDVRAMDLASHGAWSAKFATEARRSMPTLPMHLDTYKGSAAGGINLGAYRTQRFRFAIQTYWGQEGTWDDPPTVMVQWCAGADPVIPRAVVKPMFRIVANNSGEIVDREMAYANTVAAGTKGVGLYYIDGAGLDEVREWTRRAIDTGIAY